MELRSARKHFFTSAQRRKFRDQKIRSVWRESQLDKLPILRRSERHHPFKHYGKRKRRLVVQSILVTKAILNKFVHVQQLDYYIGSVFKNREKVNNGLLTADYAAFVTVDKKCNRYVSFVYGLPEIVGHLYWMMTGGLKATQEEEVATFFYQMSHRIFGLFPTNVRQQQIKDVQFKYEMGGNAYAGV